MSDLCAQFQSCFRGRVCFIGLGNSAYGDDGLGVRLAEQLIAAGGPEVIVAGTAPERFVGRVAAAGYDHVVFLDAVEFGGAPGAVVWLGSAELATRFPQVSTHKISLGLLARWIEDQGSAKVWLLGVQPVSLRPGAPLTPKIQTTLDLLTELVGGLAWGSHNAARGPQPQRWQNREIGHRSSGICQMEGPNASSQFQDARCPMPDFTISGGLGLQLPRNEKCGREVGV